MRFNLLQVKNKRETSRKWKLSLFVCLLIVVLFALFGEIETALASVQQEFGVMPPTPPTTQSDQYGSYVSCPAYMMPVCSDFKASGNKLVGPGFQDATFPFFTDPAQLGIYSGEKGKGTDWVLYLWGISYSVVLLGAAILITMNGIYIAMGTSMFRRANLIESLPKVVLVLIFGAFSYEFCQFWIAFSNGLSTNVYKWVDGTTDGRLNINAPTKLQGEHQIYAHEYVVELLGKDPYKDHAYCWLLTMNSPNGGEPVEDYKTLSIVVELLGTSQPFDRTDIKHMEADNLLSLWQEYHDAVFVRSKTPMPEYIAHPDFNTTHAWWDSGDPATDELGDERNFTLGYCPDNDANQQILLDVRKKLTTYTIWGDTWLTFDIKDFLGNVRWLMEIIASWMAFMYLVQCVTRILLLILYKAMGPLAIICWAIPGGGGDPVTRTWIRGVIAMTMCQFVQTLAIIIMELVHGAMLDFVYTNLDGLLEAETMIAIVRIAVLWFLLRIPPLLESAPTTMMVNAGNMMGQAMSSIASMNVSRRYMEEAKDLEEIGIAMAVAGLAVGTGSGRVVSKTWSSGRAGVSFIRKNGFAMARQRARENLVKIPGRVKTNAQLRGQRYFKQGGWKKSVPRMAKAGLFIAAAEGGAHVMTGSFYSPQEAWDEMSNMKDAVFNDYSLSTSREENARDSDRDELNKYKESIWEKHSYSESDYADSIIRSSLSDNDSYREQHPYGGHEVDD